MDEQSMNGHLVCLGHICGLHGRTYTLKPAYIKQVRTIRMRMRLHVTAQAIRTFFIKLYDPLFDNLQQIFKSCDLQLLCGLKRERYQPSTHKTPGTGMLLPTRLLSSSSFHESRVMSTNSCTFFGLI